MPPKCALCNKLISCEDNMKAHLEKVHGSKKADDKEIKKPEEKIKGQLNSEWIYEVIVSPKMPTKKFPDICPGSLLDGRTDFWKIFGCHFGKNDDLIDSFWI